MMTTAIAVPPAIDLSSEAGAGPWEIIIPVAIAAVALIYLARSYGFLGKRKMPGCAQCASGCGCSGQGATTNANTCAEGPTTMAPGNIQRPDA